MIHILDSDLKDKLLEIEGKGYEYHVNRNANESPYCLQGCIQEYQERCLIPIVFEDEADIKDWDYFLDSVMIGPIYGSGGWNRYPVYGTGEVKISSRLSREIDVEKAIVLGFNVH